MSLKMRVKARGRYEERDKGSCIDILTMAEVRAERYAGISDSFDPSSGGEESRESMIVGRLVSTERLGAAASAGGGERRWARRP
jgi:hypothetical protein